MVLLTTTMIANTNCTREQLEVHLHCPPILTSSISVLFITCMSQQHNYDLLVSSGIVLEATVGHQCLCIVILTDHVNILEADNLA